jgi:hypothetical protein
MNPPLSDKVFITFAMRHYNNPQCVTVEEFEQDLQRIKYIKRLLIRFKSGGELKERLILNHLIVFYNVFGIKPATKMLYFKIDEKLHPQLNSFLVYLNYADPKLLTFRDKRITKVLEQI